MLVVVCWVGVSLVTLNSKSVTEIFGAATRSFSSDLTYGTIGRGTTVVSSKSKFLEKYLTDRFIIVVIVVSVYFCVVPKCELQRINTSEPNNTII